MKSKTKNKKFLIIIGILFAFTSISTQHLSYQVEYSDNLDAHNELNIPKSSYTITWSPNGTAICLYDDYQSLPQLCYDGKRGFIITWEDNRENNLDIFAQRVDFNGETKWTPNGVAICMANDNQFSPQICNDGMGGAIITWDDNRENIYAQRIDINGAVKWEDDEPICPTDGTQNSPLICSDGKGGAIIAWNEENIDNSNISAQRIDSNGDPKWNPDGLIICNANDHQYISHICSDGTGGAIITWQDYRNGPEADIFAQRINSTGDIQWASNGVAICKADKIQSNAIASNDGDGGAIFTWKDERGNSDDIYAQRVDSEGAVKWIPNGVAICTVPADQLEPQICSDETGGAIITWNDERNGVNNWDIFAQRINMNGDIQWTSNGTVICTEKDYQYCTDITSDGEGGAFMVWEDYRGVKADIYAQHISSNEKLEWPENGTLICNANEHQFWPTMCSDEEGGVIITWQDGRNTQGYDIYAQRIKNPIPITGSNGGDDSDDNKKIEEISLIPIIGIIAGSAAMAGITIIILWKKRLFIKKPRVINK